MGQIKTERFGRHFELANQKFNFSSRDPSNYTRARHARMAQFWLKIAHLSFSIATTPLLKMIPSYGLRPRLWLLDKTEYSVHQKTTLKLGQGLKRELGGKMAGKWTDSLPAFYHAFAPVRAFSHYLNAWDRLFEYIKETCCNEAGSIHDYKTLNARKNRWGLFSPNLRDVVS